MLRNLVNVSEGGKFLYIDQLPEIPPLVPEKHEELPLESEEILWDRWETLAIFCVLITLEWILRKQWRML